MSVGGGYGTRVGYALLFFAVFAAGFYTCKVFSDNTGHLSLSPSFDFNVVGEKHTFTSPLLFCGDQELSHLTNRTSLRIETEVGKYINTQKQDGNVSEVSVCYRDLLEGPWATINPRMKATPGSLLKLPLALSVLRYGEDHPEFLDKKIVFDGGADVNEGEHYKAPLHIEAGKTYSVRTLLDYALQYSDNAAALLLVQLIPTDEINESYSRLGMQDPAPGQDYQMDVRTYSSFFRVLFNASYLSVNNSEYTLKVLSEATFTDGIVAGVPQGTIVSHKFGERSVGGATQLHDCGIVYRKNSPYILCVMSQGNNFDSLAKTIAGVSKKVYDIVESENGK